MNILLKYIVIYLISTICIFSQEIYISRSDVDVNRSSFVTATFTFTIDVYIKDVKNANGVAFELKYNLSNYIKYSQWKFGEYGSPQIINFDDGNGNGRLIVALNRGEIPLSDSINQSKVISLEFVTLQNAPNSSILTFEFVNPIATAIDINGRKIVSLNSQKTDYRINGFVNVWPGDTDNNGKVDHLDFGPVSQYVGFGSATKNMRSFKRKSGSAIWGPHQVLTWDSAAVTYADCDGNGDITVSDMLIVTYNIGKDTNSYKSKKINEKIQSKYPEPNVYSTENTKKIPIYANLKSDLIGISGIIDFDVLDNSKIYGVELASSFSSYPYNYSYKKDNQIIFVIGSFVKEFARDNLIGYLIVSNDFDDKINIRELKGINKYGDIFDLKAITNVEVNVDDITLIQNKLISNNQINTLYIYDYLGNLIEKHHNINYIDLSNLNRGIYFIKVFNDNSNVKIIKYLAN